MIDQSQDKRWTHTSELSGDNHDIWKTVSWIVKRVNCKGNERQGKAGRSTVR